MSCEIVINDHLLEIFVYHKFVTMDEHSVFSSISRILLQNWYHCVHNRECHHICQTLVLFLPELVYSSMLFIIESRVLHTVCQVKLS